jgi:hypothetical protein
MPRQFLPSRSRRSTCPVVSRSVHVTVRPRFDLEPLSVLVQEHKASSCNSPLLQSSPAKDTRARHSGQLPAFALSFARSSIPAAWTSSSHKRLRNFECSPSVAVSRVLQRRPRAWCKSRSGRSDAFSNTSSAVNRRSPRKRSSQFLNELIHPQICFAVDSTDALSRLVIKERRRRIKVWDGGVDLPSVIVVWRRRLRTFADPPHFFRSARDGTSARDQAGLLKYTAANNVRV